MLKRTKHPKHSEADQTADEAKKQGKKALTEAIQAKLEQKREKREQEKELYKESLKVKPSPAKEKKMPAPVVENTPESAPIEPKSYEKKPTPKRPKLTIDYLEHYLQHLFAIKHDVQQYELELTSLKENKDIQQKLELTHFSLLYNITRCFQALKLYKEATGNDNSKTASQPLLEDMRNMILKRGIVQADPVFTFETGKALVQILSEDLLKMRKPHLTERPFTEKQKQEIFKTLGILKGEECQRYLLEAFPIPISDTPLYQQLRQFHENLKTTDIPPKKRKDDIFVCVKKIVGYFSEIKEKYPILPQSEEIELFLTTFRRQINAIKILFTACGSLYGDVELWSEIKPKRLEQFLISCRNIIKQVAHFTNEISCDVPLKQIYHLSKLAEFLEKLNHPVMKGVDAQKNSNKNTTQAKNEKTSSSSSESSAPPKQSPKQATKEVTTPVKETAKLSPKIKPVADATVIAVQEPPKLTNESSVATSVKEAKLSPTMKPIVDETIIAVQQLPKATTEILVTSPTMPIEVKTNSAAPQKIPVIYPVIKAKNVNKKGQNASTNKAKISKKQNQNLVPTISEFIRIFPFAIDQGMTEKTLAEGHTNRIKPLIQFLFDNLGEKDRSWWTTDYYNQCDEFSEIFTTLDEEIRKEYFLILVNITTFNWKHDPLNVRNIEILPSIFRSFGEKYKKYLSSLLVAKLHLAPDNASLLNMLIRCFPDVQQGDAVLNYLFEHIKKEIHQYQQACLESKDVWFPTELFIEINYLCKGIIAIDAKSMDVDAVSDKIKALAFFIPDKHNYCKCQLFINYLKLCECQDKDLDFATLWEITLEEQFANRKEIQQWFVDKFSKKHFRTYTLEKLLQILEKAPYESDTDQLIRAMMPSFNHMDWHVIYKWVDAKFTEFPDIFSVKQVVHSYQTALLTQCPDAEFLDWEKIYKDANHHYYRELRIIAAERISPKFALEAYRACRPYDSIDLKLSLLAKLDAKTQEQEIFELISNSGYREINVHIAGSLVFSRKILSVISQKIPEYDYVLVLIYSLKSNITPEERMYRLKQILSMCELNLILRQNLPDLSIIVNMLKSKLNIEVNKELISQLVTLILKIKEIKDYTFYSDKKNLFKLLNYLIPQCQQQDLVSAAKIVYDIGWEQPFDEDYQLLDTLAAYLPEKEIETKQDRPSHGIYTRDQLALKMLDYYPTLVKRNSCKLPSFLSKIIPFVSLDVAKAIFNTIFNNHDLPRREVIDMKPFFVRAYQSKSSSTMEFKTLFMDLFEVSPDYFIMQRYFYVVQDLIEFLPFISQQTVVECLAWIDVKKHIVILGSVSELVAAMLGHCDSKQAYNNFVSRWAEQLLSGINLLNVFSATLFLNRVSLQLLKIYKREVALNSLPLLEEGQQNLILEYLELPVNAVEMKSSSIYDSIKVSVGIPPLESKEASKSREVKSLVLKKVESENQPATLKQTFTLFGKADPVKAKINDLKEEIDTPSIKRLDNQMNNTPP